MHQLLHGLGVGEKSGPGAISLAEPDHDVQCGWVTEQREFGIELLVKVGDHREWVHFLLGKIQSHKVILGHDWLKRHNPDIDWKKAELSLTRCPPQCSPSPQSPHTSENEYPRICEYSGHLFS